MAPISLYAEVGRRIRLARRAAGLSQTELGDALGITFQQLQKYELGINRISIGRLVHLAAALDVPLSNLTNGLEALVPKKGKRRP